VFLLNSHQGLFAATPKRSIREGFHAPGHSFSRSYGVNLPSSLREVLSSALVRLYQSTSVGLRYGHP
jgi:hypothetical protein